MTIKELHNLVHQFTEYELGLIRYNLKSTKTEIGNNKYLQLFEFIITQKKNINRHDVSRVLYNTSPDTRINKLISRLSDKIQEFVTSDIFLAKNDRLNERSLLRIGVRKKVLRFTTVGLLNGYSDAFAILLENCIQDAIKAEYYMPLIELYSMKNQFAILNNNVKESNFCTQEIIYYKKCYDIQEKIVNVYNELAKDDNKGVPKSQTKKIRYLRKVINEINKKRKYIVSDYSKYMYSIIQLEYFYVNGNFHGAKKFLNQVNLDLKLSRLGSANLNVPTRIVNELGICEVYLGNYKQAIKLYEKALELLRGKNRLNYYISLQGLFHAVFYNREFLRAETILMECLSDQYIDLKNFRTSKPNYFQACIHFKNGEYKKALSIVNKPMVLSKDKNGYDIAIRILRIKCLIELNRFDEAATHIENLRKHVSRNSKKTYTTERDQLITRVLILMQKRGFTGKQNKTESELMKKLSDPTGKFKWMPMTPELIRFHEWYAEKNNLLINA